MVEQLPPRVLFGAAYYHEYQQVDRLKEDLDLMAEARFSVIRVGESVWSTWEPENGRFELDWLRPVLDGAHERGIAVILGTAGAPARKSTSPTPPSDSTPTGSSEKSSPATRPTRP